MNNRPPISSSPSNAIGAYRKRRQRRRPSIIFILAGALIIGGLILLIVWLMGASKPLNALFATDTPTPTMTFTPTGTATSTTTPTVTATFTITVTATFSSPFNYTVQQGDYLALISDKYNLGADGIALILLLNPYDPATGTGIDPATQNIIPGEVILLPNPGMKLPTATPIPPDLPRGTKITYTVQAGDTLAAVADKFSSTTDDIVKENNITDPNALFAGQQLIIPVNMVTATPTFPPTSTPRSDTTATWTPVN